MATDSLGQVGLVLLTGMAKVTVLAIALQMIDILPLRILAMSWPLTQSEIAQFITLGLKSVYLEDYLDAEDPPVRRFRDCYQKEMAYINKE